MTTLSAKITLYAPGCHSLKEKRRIVQSIISKTKIKFNTSAAEVDFLDMHQKIAIGIAVVSGSHSHAQNMLDEIVRFIDTNADAEMINVEFMD